MSESIIKTMDKASVIGEFYVVNTTYPTANNYNVYVTLPSGYTAENCCIVSYACKPSDAHGYAEMAYYGLDVRITGNKLYLYQNRSDMDAWVGKPLRIVLLKIS